jgi:biotin synthase
MKNIEDLLQQEHFSRQDLIQLLQTDIIDRNKIYAKAAEIKTKYVGNKVYYRGLVEFSNKCIKDCYYCGIRASNSTTVRYDLSDESILYAVKYAYENNYASVVFQSGERQDNAFVKRITNLLRESKKITNNEIGITISLGEQSSEVYQEWFDAGAHRYLLRIESSNRELFEQIHPKNERHLFETRMQALYDLQDIGYQTGSGVMIGLPFQTVEHLADDLLFFKNFGIDMVGMGPYVEHTQTPLYRFQNQLLPQVERFNLTLKMIALLRIIMKDINIAAATALQAIDKAGREKALKVGANIIMPNITPTENRSNYLLYENKPCIDESADDCSHCLEARIHLAGDSVGYNEWGDSWHYKKRMS